MMTRQQVIRILGMTVWATSLEGCWDEPATVVIPTVDSGMDGSVPDDWRGFGSACDVDEDCKDYPSNEKRCIHNCVGLINTPGGYCTSCCDEAGRDVCAPGIDCVGFDDVYLVCLAHCHSDTDCRQDEGYECRPIYFIPDDFPGNYCLPREEFVEPDDQDASIEEALCPWPWLDTTGTTQ